MLYHEFFLPDVVVFECLFLPITSHAKKSSNQLDMIHKYNLIMWTEATLTI